ncbi:MAG TPA: GGDEF domain-containing protein, partial [Turneriella sp.]|nr:GGDEF domain-containing protein [Turneriella sp.]
KETATRIRAALRENEIFGRIGGEEFAIFIPQVTRENAVLLAERVRVVVSGLPYKLESASIPVTLSVGVCHATGRTPLEKFLERADKALYKSKRTGRNKVTI